MGDGDLGDLGSTMRWVLSFFWGEAKPNQIGSRRKAIKKARDRKRCIQAGEVSVTPDWYSLNTPMTKKATLERRVRVLRASRKRSRMNGREGTWGRGWGLGLGVDRGIWVLYQVGGRNVNS